MHNSETGYIDGGNILYRVMGEGGLRPTQAHEGDAGWDLYTSREVTVPPNSFTDIHVDIAMALPKGLWAMITGRSSTIRTYHLRVETAIIDNGYRGEMYAGVWNHNDYPIIIPVGTRLAQLIIFGLYNVNWVQVPELPPSSRGTQGFGHSGR